MANVTETHPQYAAAEPAWSLCRDVTSGARAVKAKGVLYLPKPAGMDRGDYASYNARAAFFPAAGRTIQALTGAVFTRPPMLVGVPAVVLAQLADATLTDIAITDLAVQMTQEILTIGRAGLLLDLAEDGGAGRPYWSLVSAERIVNWRCGPVGTDPDQLAQLVIREDVTTPTADGFGRVHAVQYRELAIVDGVYRMRLWTGSSPAIVTDTTAMPFTAGPWVVPTRRGQPLDFIPFSFVNPSGVGPDIEKPPLEDLCDLVIAHFRNSADHEYGLFLTALPTVWAAGLAGANQRLKIGPSVAWVLEKDGKAGMLEFTGAGLGAIREAMSAKERQMAVLGGRLLLEASTARTETAASVRLRYSAETASLRTIASAVSTAVTRLVRWHCWWLGAGDVDLTITFALTDEFFSLKATADEVRASLLLYQSDSISFDTFFNQLQLGGWTREGVTADQERAAIAQHGGTHGVA